MKVLILASLGFLVAGAALRSLQSDSNVDANFIAPVSPGAALDSVAAISLTHPERVELLYVRHRGRWRCATAFGAPVLEPDLISVVGSLRNAQGLMRGQPGQDLGFPFFSLGLHGPGIASAEDRDLRAGFDLATKGPHSWVRPRGEAWLEVPDGFTSKLAWPEDANLPPLVDDHLVASAWPTGFPGIDRVFIDRSDGAELELAQGSPQTATAEDSEAWFVRDAEGLHPVLPYRLAGYFNYLLRVRYRGLADPRKLEDQRLDTPWAVVTLALTGGETVVLRVGAPEGATNGQGIFVLNAALPLLGQVGSQDPDWLAPTRSMLIEKSIGNPWEQWLTR